MGLSDVMDIATAGLVAQRARITVTASNIANAETTRTEEGGPYRRRDPVFSAEPIGGAFGDALEREIRSVEVSEVVADEREPTLRFQPGHPDANAEGYVAMPNVDVVEELVNLTSAGRSYEANLVVMKRAKEMTDAALQIGR